MCHLAATLRVVGPGALAFNQARGRQALDRGPQVLGVQMGVDRRGQLRIAVPEELLRLPEAGAVAGQAARQGVPERMDAPRPH